MSAKSTEQSDTDTLKVKYGPAFKDDSQNRLLLVNYQVDLVEEGGAAYEKPYNSGIVGNTVKLIDENSDKWTYVVPTMRNHFFHQIKFPTIWMDAQGNPPEVGTTISLEEFTNGTWKLNEAASWNGLDNEDLVYNLVKNFLEDLASKYENLTIEAPHCLHGTPGQCLIPEINEARFEHSRKRQYAPEAEMHGAHPLVRSKSVFGTKIGNALGKMFLKSTFQAKRVFLAGYGDVQASASHLSELIEEHSTDDNPIEIEVYVIKDLCSEDFSYFHVNNVKVVESSQVASLISV